MKRLATRQTWGSSLWARSSVSPSSSFSQVWRIIRILRSERSLILSFLLLRSQSVTRSFATSASKEKETEQKELEVLPNVRVLGVSLIKSRWHQTRDIRSTIATLHLDKIHQIAYHPNTASVRGKLFKVQLFFQYLVTSLSDLIHLLRSNISSKLRLFLSPQNWVMDFGSAY